MKLFECQRCGQLLYFENTRCNSCGRDLGYLPARGTITALEADGDVWRALVEPEGRYRYCANHEFGACNWLLPAAAGERFCAACRHNRMIPDLSQGNNLAHWRRIEIAKHRLFYTLLRLRLPLTTRPQDANGLAFDFLADQAHSSPVMTGHANGLITINLAEADDAERERQRGHMGEPYRTLLGHFRHEIAHYYWGRLIANSPSLARFRTLFGDERKDYGKALARHYASGPPADWPERFVTAYASSHPWEDFAETWAHYLHMVDTLETASAFGLRVRPKLSPGAAELAADIDFDPHDVDMKRLVEAWLPLTLAMNSINRSMGQPDLYPFVPGPAVMVKLGFVHERIHAQHARQPDGASADDLRAMIASLKRSVATPDRA